jgi:hypothetical protein
MNHPFHLHPLRSALRTLCAGVLIAALPQVCCAAPGQAAPAVAPKPKLAPRPIPGMSGSAAPAPSQPLAPTAKRVAPKSQAPSVASSGVEQARILKIYRSGTVAVPPPPPEAARASEPADAGLVRPASLATPRPGQVRIISKAEAEALAAQPEP